MGLCDLQSLLKVKVFRFQESLLFAGGVQDEHVSQYFIMVVELAVYGDESQLCHPVF